MPRGRKKKQEQLSLFKITEAVAPSVDFLDLVPAHQGWLYSFKRTTAPVSIARVLMRKDYPEFSKGNLPSLHNEAPFTVQEVDTIIKGTANDPRLIALASFKEAGNADKLIDLFRDGKCETLSEIYPNVLSLSIVMLDENKVYVDKNTNANVKNVTIVMTLVVVCKDGIYEANIVTDRQHLGYDA